MTSADLKHLLRYTSWANSEILETLLNVEQPPAKAVRLMAHLLAAEHLWLDRMTSETRNHVVWPDWHIYDCDSQQHELETRWRLFLENLSEAELDRVVSYTNSRGEKFTNTVREILTHLVMHAPHHRGQINAVLRDEGYDPPYVDYIHAVRTNKL